MEPQIRRRSLLVAFVVGTTIHAVTMGLVFGEVLYPYWWMSIVTGVSGALAWAGAKVFRARASVGRRSAEVDAVR